MYEMNSALLALRDDANTRILLVLYPLAGGTSLCLDQGIALMLPGGPQLLGFREPSGFGQAAGDGGGEQEMPRSTSYDGPDWQHASPRDRFAAGPIRGVAGRLCLGHAPAEFPPRGAPMVCRAFSCSYRSAAAGLACYLRTSAHTHGGANGVWQDPCCVSGRH